MAADLPKMPNPTFAERAKSWLVQYRNESLGSLEDGEYRHRGKIHRLPHILPFRDRKLNVIAMYRESYYASRYAAIKEHRYFHHLNSSQAFCVNLFFPLIAENALGAFAEHCKVDLGEVLEAQFERESELEHYTRKTSFDFFVAGSNARLFVEVKYTEAEFGGCKADEAHQTRFRDEYLPMVKDSRFLRSCCSDSDTFLGKYQILRNLVHIRENDHVVFLIHPDNREVVREALDAQEMLLNDAGRARLHIVYQPALVHDLSGRYRGTKLGDYYRQFSQKYFPDAEG